MTGRCRATPNCFGSIRLLRRAFLRFPRRAGSCPVVAENIPLGPVWAWCPSSGDGSVCSMALCRREQERGKPFREGLPSFRLRRPETREAASFRRKRLPLYSHPETFSGQGLNTRTGRKKQAAYRTLVSGKVRPLMGSMRIFPYFPNDCQVDVMRAPVMALVGPSVRFLCETARRAVFQR